MLLLNFCYTFNPFLKNDISYIKYYIKLVITVFLGKDFINSIKIYFIRIKFDNYQIEIGESHICSEVTMSIDRIGWSISFLIHIRIFKDSYLY